MKNEILQEHLVQYSQIVDFLQSDEFEKDTFISGRNKHILKKRILEKKTFSEISKEFKISKNRACHKFNELIERRVIKCAVQKDSLETKIVDCKLFIVGNGMRWPGHFEDLGLIYMKHLNNFPASQIMELRNWGPKVVKRLNDYISNFGISLKNDLPPKYSWIFKTEIPIQV